jgi:hypothetical protein
MKRYAIVVIDENGREWCADGFKTKKAATEEARAVETKRGWKLAEVFAYTEED